MVLASSCTTDAGGWPARSRPDRYDETPKSRAGAAAVAVPPAVADDKATKRGLMPKASVERMMRRCDVSKAAAAGLIEASWGRHSTRAEHARTPKAQRSNEGCPPHGWT